jgi:uncharacterized protein YbbC (DUF1343 family)
VIKTISGLSQLVNDSQSQALLKGNVAYLCHSASVTPDFEIGVMPLKRLLGKRLVKLMGPQHGFVTDVQDNMIETGHFHHPYFDLPVYSLYSDTRKPNETMLDGVDTLVVDLQDVGTRVYTYISTLGLAMQACAEKGIRLVVLDRPNPVGGDMIEGNVLLPQLKSFVGLYEMPMRHGMTMGEVALYAKKELDLDIDLHVIAMKNWRRSMYWRETGLPWVNPSPNLSTPESAITFCGSVLFEGTNISEGRGTTRALEIVGAPGIEPFSFADKVTALLPEYGINGVVLRPIQFAPTFQKHAGKSCGGVHIHPTSNQFKSWRLGQVLMHVLYRELGEKFAWNDRPYEYEFDRLAIDFINGDERLRQWVETSGDPEKLIELENDGIEAFNSKRQASLLYS